nr:helix-turn-helix transcriptional regulator [Kitasatospora mediocidica]
MRQRRLGAELRKMREQAGLTGAATAKLLGVGTTQVSQMESGRIGVSADRLRTFAACCRCMNQPLIEALVDMVHERGKGWYESYRGIIPAGFLEVAEVELHAHSIQTWVTTHMPGLLQTTRYAEGVFSRIIPAVPRHEMDARTAFRIQRRNILLGPNATPLEAFIHEAALHIRFGGQDVLRDQLESLLTDSEREGISVRIVPFAAETFPGAIENLNYTTGPISELDTVELDSSRGPLFFDAKSELESYRAILQRTESVALSPEKSRELIRSVARNL